MTDFFWRVANLLPADTTPDLTAGMRPDDRDALRDAFESGKVRRAFDTATLPCRPRVTSTRYPRAFIDSDPTWSWYCPRHGQTWMEPVRPYNNAVKDWPTQAEAINDAADHVAREAGR